MHENTPPGQARPQQDALLPHETLEQAQLDAARPEKVARQHGRGKLTARERIDLLVDALPRRKLLQRVTPRVHPVLLL